MRPELGDLLRVDGRASVQFAGERALTFRVVSVCDRPTYAGWLWLTGYVLDRRGLATARREIYVQAAGLRRAQAASSGVGGVGRVGRRRRGTDPGPRQ
ncbi:hypothetical protein [Micromonospora coerulea]|uniref:hypothetical protein n=1 Tax=Micromonospora coerulea TaxID=47856 RepID=UPI0027DB016A|nr:hypothetical protein [Micromonospora veneta]